MLFMLCVLSQTRAQMYNVYVKNADGKPLKGVLVYTFPTKAKAEAAYKDSKADGFLSDNARKSLVEEGKTDESGLCVIRAMSSGSIILDGGAVISGMYDFTLFHIEKYQKSELDFNLELVLTGKEFSAAPRPKKRTISASEQGEFAGGGEAEDLKQVTKTATPAMQAMGDGIAERHGNKVMVTKELDIEGEYARDDARFVAFPFVVLEEKGDTVYMPPAVVDGQDYGNSMVRRMSFQVSRDKLEPYHFDRSMHMQAHNSERFLYSKPADITKGTKYHVPGILWYEDYNGVYHRDSMLFSDGKEREPMRFLNWSDVRDLAPIERERFVKRGTYEAVADNESFNLEFEVGKARLNLNDSATVAARDSMLRWLSSYYRTGSISKIEIRGYSSPEGSVRSNQSLSRARAETIRSLLASNFPGTTIKPEFDEYDNIVPWDKVADVMMTEMDDTVARMNAVKLKEMVAGITDLDKQYAAVRANPELYRYLLDNVLERVRKVDIQANIVVQKILSKEEILDRYENVADFRYKMLDYQYYVMMCHLADNERWDELYDVSKRAYEKFSKEREVQRQILANPSDTSLTYVPTMVPYPLAGYYYAVSTLRRGMMNVNILKPYLDDGGVGEQRGGVLNSLPFIVGQVLMYCQGEDFGKANHLIRKYRLMSYPHLKGLIMFVRCLDGQYKGPENEDVRQYVMASSPMNKAVMLTALGQYREAIELLYSDEVPNPDAKVEYMKAICHFRLQPSRLTALNVDGYSGSAMYADSEDDVDSGDDADDGKQTLTNPTAWAAPMLNALRLENSNVDYLENDGYFNNAYRQMVMYFWKRLQMGVPIERVVAEYDALVARMRKEKAQEMVN